jgi:hypothetical protein
MRPIAALLLLAALAATQVAALHCPGGAEGGGLLAAQGEAPGPDEAGLGHHAAAHGHNPHHPAVEHPPEGAPDPDAHDHRGDHEHQGTPGCTSLLACGGAAVPLADGQVQYLDAPLSPGAAPAPGPVGSALLAQEPPPPKPVA